MFALALALALLVACADAGDPGPAADARPAADAEVGRIVSLGGPVTEAVFALGAGASVVGVDASSTWPPEVGALPQVGYVRSASAEGILSLKPDRVLASDELGPAQIRGQLEAAGVRVTILPGGATAEGARARIDALASVLDRQARGQRLVAQLDEELAAARALPPLTPPPRVVFVYARGAGRMLVAGEGTGAAEMIALAGGALAVSGFQGFKPLTPEALLAAAPDALLMPSGGVTSLGGEAAVLDIPGVREAFGDRPPRLIHMDDQLLLGFGPRLGQGVAQLHELLAGLTAAPEESR